MDILQAVQTVVTELRSMLEQSQKQLAKESEEKLALKSEHEKLLHQIDVNLSLYVFYTSFSP